MSLHFTLVIKALLADTAGIALLIRMHHIDMSVIISSVFDDFKALRTLYWFMPIGMVLGQSIMAFVRRIA